MKDFNDSLKSVRYYSNFFLPLYITVILGKAAPLQYYLRDQLLNINHLSLQYAFPDCSFSFSICDFCIILNSKLTFIELILLKLFLSPSSVQRHSTYFRYAIHFYFDSCFFGPGLTTVVCYFWSFIGATW